MEKVIGIGGLFVRAQDPAALASWYKKHLGLPIDENWNGAVMPGLEQGGNGTGGIWSAFPHDTEYFGSTRNQFMINFRVADRDAILEQLRAADCNVDERTEDSEFGHFGWVTDPEGNRIELWQAPEISQ